ncbi:MAG TPA: septal ring lytic transglycosylase RlpA family protein [Acidimicrobiales bacterium]|nr:septal ring lytic transglycosylase RlpA family protein [Acidimicrobiales bacterium]
MPLVAIKSGSSSAAPGPGGGAGHAGANGGSHSTSAAPKPAGYFPAWQLAADTIRSSAASVPGVGQPVAPTTVATTPATTATTSAPSTTSLTPTTHAAVVQAAAPATTSPAPVPVAPTTSTAPAPAAAANSITGVVTYYDATPGTCASPTLPFGTVVTITNPDNGATVSCTVDDREADTERQIDLATATFAQIAPLSQGVISDAELSW